MIRVVSTEATLALELAISIINIQNVPMQKNSYLYNFISALLALIAWGGWAYYINQDLTSAAIQGCASFVITLIMVRLLSKLRHYYPHEQSRVIGVSLLTVSTTGSGLVLFHCLADTSSIFATISPPLCVALSFCLITATKLEKTTNGKAL